MELPHSLVSLVTWQFSDERSLQRHFSTFMSSPSSLCTNNTSLPHSSLDADDNTCFPALLLMTPAHTAISFFGYIWRIVEDGGNFQHLLCF